MEEASLDFALKTSFAAFRVKVRVENVGQEARQVTLLKPTSLLSVLYIYKYIIMPSNDLLT